MTKIPVRLTLSPQRKHAKLNKDESAASSGTELPNMGSIQAEVYLLQMLEKVFLSETDLEIDVPPNSL